jgi:hypothetical protein
MIRQDDSRLNINIQKYGCYFMSILYFVNKYDNFGFSADIINGLYVHFVTREYMTDTCFVLNPEAIFEELGLPVEMVFLDGSHRIPPEAQVLEDEFEILFFKREGHHGHFVAGDGFGNVAYDPAGNSLSVRHGELLSKRVFRRE